MTNRLLHCVRCGQLFMANLGTTCAPCLEREEQEFEAVRRFLEQNPKSPTVEVSMATGVPPGVITKFVRQGRLTAELMPADLAAEWLRRMDAAKRLQSASSRKPPMTSEERVAESVRLLHETYLEHKQGA